MNWTILGLILDAVGVIMVFYVTPERYPDPQWSASFAVEGESKKGTRTVAETATEETADSYRGRRADRYRLCVSGFRRNPLLLIPPFPPPGRGPPAADPEATMGRTVSLQEKRLRFFERGHTHCPICLTPVH